MSNPKGKALPNLISMYLIMLVIYCLDVFFLKSDLTVLGDNFYSRFLCLTVLLMTVVFKREHLITFGIRRKATKLKSAFIFGTFFSVVRLQLFQYLNLYFLRYSIQMPLISISLLLASAMCKPRDISHRLYVLRFIF